jgi:phosphatidylinositol alpha-1,6-mannosyltransferase
MNDVLILTPDFPPQPGGIQLLMHRIASNMTRYRPVVITLGERDAEAFDRKQSFSVVRTGSRTRGHRLRVVALNGAGVRAALRLRPRAILNGHIVTGPAALIAQARLGIPVVQYAYAKELNRRPRLAQEVLRRADRVIAISQHTLELAVALGANRSQVRIVHPGVDSSLNPLGASRRDSSSIVSVARLEERYKGHDVLLRALPLVRVRVPGARLHIVGDGRLRPDLERLSHALGIEDTVIFHGRVSDADRDNVLDCSAVFALPSRTDSSGSGEGFGIVYVEAGARGLPVVAGRVAGAIDAVVDGETGLLVDPEDHVAVANAISALLLDPAAAKRMGDAGRQRAQTLSWERAAASVESVLDEAAAR